MSEHDPQWIPGLLLGLACVLFSGGREAVGASDRAPASAPATRLAAASSRPSNAITPPARRDVPGRRAALRGGALYVPDFFKPQPGGVDVVIWFLGASWCTEQTFYDARRNAVLVTVNAKDLAAAFKDPQSLPALLDEVAAWLRGEGAASSSIARVCLVSFSGGYVGVREILRQRESLARVTDVVLADSLYAPRVQGTTDQLAIEAMAPFADYAARAAKGECTLWFSHLYPPEERYRGNTTTLAASYLIDHVKAKRQAASGQNSRGAKLLYRADLGQFHVLGYAGMTNQDHFDHFYAAGDLIRRTSLATAPSDE